MSGWEMDEDKLKKFQAAAGIAKQMSGAQGQGGTDEKSGAMSGAVSGAMSGAAFGPHGAAIGGVAGAVMGVASARAARKAHNAQVEAKKLEALGEIEEKKQQRIADILAQMGGRMSAGLR